MITELHRTKINEAKFARRLQYPYRLRCLPSDQQDRWLPLPNHLLPEVQSFMEAALNRRTVEMADYAIATPRLVSAEPKDGRIFLYPLEAKPLKLLWLRWSTPTFRLNLLVDDVRREYYLASGPTVFAMDIDTPQATYRKSPQFTRWIQWLSERHPEVHSALAQTRPR